METPVPSSQILLKTVLFATDFSADSMRALPYATRSRAAASWSERPPTAPGSISGSMDVHVTVGYPEYREERRELAFMVLISRRQNAVGAANEDGALRRHAGWLKPEIRVVCRPDTLTWANALCPACRAVQHMLNF